MTPTLDLIVESRAPVRVVLPDNLTVSDAQLFLGLRAGAPHVLVFARKRADDPTPGAATLLVDQPWDVAGSMGLPSRGHIWQLGTPVGPVQVVPVRGCTSCGGAWWTRHDPFPDNRGPTLRRFLAERGVGE